MSDQFRAMYGAMELVNNIANSKAPSKLALTRAFDELSAKAAAEVKPAEKTAEAKVTEPKQNTGNRISVGGSGMKQ